MNILITGFSGHIGSFFLKKFISNKKINKIYLFDNFENNKLNIIFFKKNIKKCSLKFGDLSKKNSLKNFPKVDTVIHLASLTNASSSLNNYKKYYDNNYLSFLNVYKYCKKNKSNLIHISSTSVYGSNKKFVDESCIDLVPQSPYAKIKLDEEKFLKKNRYKINFITLRFGTITGVSEGIRFHTAINRFCFNTIMKLKIPVWRTALNQYRPYLSLKDAYKAVNAIILKKKYDGGIYNVLSNNHTVKQILNIIRSEKYTFEVKLTKSKIMNQLSYKVSKDKFEKKYLKLNRNIRLDIKETLNLFKNLKVIR